MAADLPIACGRTEDAGPVVVVDEAVSWLLLLCLLLLSDNCDDAEATAEEVGECVLTLLLI